MPKKLLIIFVSLILLISLVFVTFWSSYQGFLSSKISDSLILEIPAGTSKSEIFSLFPSNRGITGLKKFYIKLYYALNKNTVVEAGNYVFKENTKYLDILSGFQGGSLLQRVTLLEGWRVEESALYLANAVNIDFALDYYLEAKKHEGRLFPDTYFIDQNTSAQSLVSLQLKTFNEKIAEISNTKVFELSSEELLVIASIVEREANKGDDLPTIAGILIKRYVEGMPLDADATTQYAIKDYSDNTITNCIKTLCEIDFWPKSLSEEDLASDSLYNTRGKVGLPPTPISNPSLNALIAVFSPKQSPYYYYLHDISGETYFAVTLEQHIENIRKYL